jgi:endonuclease/exonuclease/phosphatase family metal-dependent hydrolase
MMRHLAWVGVVLLMAGPSECRAEGPALRVMSFNIRYGTAGDGANAWDKRKDLLVETIRAFDPDLLGTQEVLDFQADFLAETLAGYSHVGVGRDDGKRAGEFSSVYFKSKRFELVDSGTFWLSETPERPGSKSWDSSLPRVATWVKLADRDAGGRQLCFLNTHWDHRGEKARVEAGRIIRAWLDEHAKGLPTVVTGDFNVTETHQGLRALLAEDGNPPLRDVYRVVQPESGEEEATFHGFSGRRRGRRIDFILASPEWKVQTAAINTTNREGRYPSDHFPVEAVLEEK